VDLILHGDEEETLVGRGPEQAAGALRSPVPLRKNRDFLLLWSGVAFASLGNAITSVVYPLLVVWDTGSAAAGGLVTAAAVLPHLVVQLPAGVLVDRLDRRRLMILCDLGCIAVTATALVAVALGVIWLPHLMLVAFLHGSFVIFYNLSERTAVRHVVHESHVSKALGQNEARTRAVGMVGDPLGSILFSALRWTPFLLTVVMHVISLVELLLIRKKFQLTSPDRPRASFSADVGYGFRWLWRQRFLRVGILVIAASNLVFAGIGLTLLMIVHDAGRSPAVVGFIFAAGGLGGVIGAATATWWRRRMSVRAVLAASLIVWTGSLMLLAFVTDPVPLGVMFAVNSAMGGVINVVGMVYLVQVAPDEVLGRAMSVMQLLASGSNFLGVLTIGAALEIGGVTRTVVGMSAVMAALAMITLTHPAAREAEPSGAGAGSAR
jgi:MFS family permease